MALLKLLALVSLFGAVAWFIASPGYEPALAVFGALAVLVAFDKHKHEEPGQQQTVSENGIGIQAGGDVKLEAAENKLLEKKVNVQ
jgi:hypothetical protein